MNKTIEVRTFPKNTDGFFIEVISKLIDQLNALCPSGTLVKRYHNDCGGLRTYPDYCRLRLSWAFGTKHSTHKTILRYIVLRPLLDGTADFSVDLCEDEKPVEKVRFHIGRCRPGILDDVVFASQLMRYLLTGQGPYDEADLPAVTEKQEMILVPRHLTMEMYRAMMALTERAPYISVREQLGNPTGKQWEVTSAIDDEPETVMHRVATEEEAEELQKYEEVSLGWAGLIKVATEGRPPK